MAAFIDKVKIKVESGRGGNGAVAWRREKFVDKGGPAGGDGGRGGNIYFVADENMSTLLDFTYKSVYKAQDGENGHNKNCHGKDGKDIFLKTPVGVIVRDLKTGRVIADLDEHEKTVLIDLHSGRIRFYHHLAAVFYKYKLLSCCSCYSDFINASVLCII